MTEEQNEQTDMNLIDSANKAAQRIEQANKIQKELLDRQASLDARRLLGGQTEAGVKKEPEISEAEKIELNTKQMFKGTLLEKYLK